ncbi:MAG: monooxygenase [Myxococcota bacterium]
MHRLLRATLRSPVVLAFGLLAVAAAGCGDDVPSGNDGDEGADGATSTATGDDAGPATGDDGVAASVNYYKDIKPILDGRCATCHSVDGIAPFPLLTYADAVEYGPSSVPSVLEKTMPPWPPNDDCATHVANRSLNDEQIDVFMEWIDLGMPEGDPAEEGAPMDPPSPGLTRIDKTLSMPTEYSVTQSPDDYRCFLIPWPEEYTTTQYVSGFGADPGNDKTVHHIIAFLAGPEDVAVYEEMDAAEDGPGYTCFGGTGGPSRTWLGGWAPGSAGSDLPEGLGIAVEPGSMIVLQVHYNALSLDAAPDLSSINLKVEDSVEKEAFIVPFANPGWLAGGMRIPAGESDVMHEFSADVSGFVGGDLTIYSSALHMHLLGTRAHLSIDRADGSNECLLQIDDWDFAWQGSYGYESGPKRVTEGDEVRIECHYDNSPENQPLIGGERGDPVDVGWGEGTHEEMCLGVMLATVD